jgi:diaminopimelate epimerase
VITRFEKFEGLGNDFIIVTAEADSRDARALAPRMCDRHFGIGADGLLFVLPPSGGGAARMKVVNADGSVPEMCGNGLRCVALFVAEQRDMTEGELVIETDAGLRACRFEREGDSGEVDVDMGVVRVLGPRVLTVNDVAIEMTLADAGNPHAVVYSADPEKDLAAEGPPLATHASFERGTNVELVRWQGAVIEVAVWERGAGRTLACGTGACAVAAVACARGEVKSGEPVRVRLPGGELLVTHDRVSGQTRMKGPARRVFRGEWLGPPTS